MTRQILFVQGGGEGAYDAWDIKLVDSLTRALGPGYEVRYPRMPNEEDPQFAAWRAALGEELGRLEAGAVLVGHSIGATVLVHSLADGLAARSPSPIFLVSAPFVGPGGWPSDDIKPKPDLGANLPAPVYLYQGDADETTPAGHVDLYAKAIPQAVVRRLPGRDHQLNNNLSEVAADIRDLDRRR